MPGRHGKQVTKRGRSKRQRPSQMENTLKDLMPMFAASPVAPERRIEKTQQGSAANPSKAKAKVAPAAQVQKSSKSPVKKAAPPVVQLNAKKNKAIQQK